MFDSGSVEQFHIIQESVSIIWVFDPLISHFTFILIFIGILNIMTALQPNKKLTLSSPSYLWASVKPWSSLFNYIIDMVQNNIEKGFV